MTTTSQPWTEETLEVAGSRIKVLKGGSGEPLLVLHDEMGHPGWLQYHQALAQDHTLYIPLHPGFGESPQLDWVMSMHDLAMWYLGALDDLKLEGVKVLAFSLGGWLAAEMAVMCPQQFRKLVLVGAAGVKPPTGEIFDIFQVVARAYLTRSVLDPSSVLEFSQVCPDEPTEDQSELWEMAREGACRLSWRPYMHYPALPYLLPRLKRLPTLLVWGRQDPIIPLSAGQLYHDCIPDSRLVVLDDCGHRPEIEKPQEFLRSVQQFLREG
jgi:pimeloyl-ACP methyl ester carboxylesterase